MDTNETPSTFAELGIIAPLVETLIEIGYESPTPIQASSIPVLMSGSDLLGQAQTGTGKTGAFALPLLSRIDLNIKAPQILVLTPTRELTIQVAEAFQTYARKLKTFHVLPIYGGQSMSNQLHQLKRGPQVIVGTPGRVMDHLRRGSLELSSLKALVLDEADEMLNMGFVEDIEWILEHTPTEKQIALFSATMPDPIKRVAGKYLRNAQEIKIKTRTSTVETISQHYWLVAGLHKLDALTRILEVEDFDAGLIFVRTKTATVELAEKLEARGHACAALNGDLSQEIRERTINALKRGELDLIVATDVAARGLDVERVTHVINYDIPHDPEAYVHRIGRTGRAGRLGKAILFVAPRERRLLSSIERTTRQPIQQLQLPTKKEVSQKRIQRFKDQVKEAIGSQELSYFETIISELSAESESSELTIAATLCYLMQQESPFVLEETYVEDRPRRERDSGYDNRDERRTGGRDSGGRDRGRGDGRERGREFTDRLRDTRDSRRSRDTGSSRENRPPRVDDEDMMRFRIEVGRDHGVSPSNIVGAIANSIGLEGRSIGQIQLFDDYSTVDLPKALPREALTYLQSVHVKDRKLRISPLELGASEGGTDRRQGRDEGRGERSQSEFPQGKKKFGGSAKTAERHSYGERPRTEKSSEERGKKETSFRSRTAGKSTTDRPTDRAGKAPYGARKDGARKGGPAGGKFKKSKRERPSQ